METTAARFVPDTRRKAFEDARFGLFLHWGPYSAAGIEASWPIMAPEIAEAVFRIERRIAEADYVRLPERFDPVGFDADEWVRIAKDAGMRYIMFTAKHHDGFCMFDAPDTDYKITKTPFGRDVCKELAAACEKAGMPLGFYYSPPDMHHPGYRDTSRPATENWTGEPKRKEWASYLDFMESHVRTLMTGYGKIHAIWFDALVNHNKYDPARFKRLIREIDPDTLVNDRLGDDYDFITPEQFIPKAGVPVRTGKPPAGVDPGGDAFFRLVCGAYRLPLLRGWLRGVFDKYAEGGLELTKVLQAPYPSPDRFQPWETCMTMGSSWACNPDEKAWKSPAVLIRNLLSVVARGGNYLLAVGPTGLGTFPPETVERLQRIGAWIRANGDAVFGTTYAPRQVYDGGCAAWKDGTLFLHVFDWPEEGALRVAGLPHPVAAARLLRTGQALPIEADAGHGAEGAVRILLQEAVPDAEATAIALDLAAAPGTAGWPAYDDTILGARSAAKYLRTQMFNSFWINALINGLLAWWTYRVHPDVPFLGASIDLWITIAIIAFLTSWLNVLDARGKRDNHQVRRPASNRRWRLPKGAGTRGLVLMLLCVVGLGGVVLSGGMLLLGVTSIGAHAYFAVKTLCTGVTGALAAALGVLSVFHEKEAGT